MKNEHSSASIAFVGLARGLAMAMASSPSSQPINQRPRDMDLRECFRCAFVYYSHFYFNSNSKSESESNCTQRETSLALVLRSSLDLLRFLLFSANGFATR